MRCYDRAGWGLEGWSLVDAWKLGLFAIEALGLVGVLFVLHRIIRTAKRRSEPINMADGASVPSVGGRSETTKRKRETIRADSQDIVKVTPERKQERKRGLFDKRD